MSNDDNDERLRDAALREQAEFQTAELCRVMIDGIGSLQAYLEQQVLLLQALRDGLPEDAESIRSEVDKVYRDVGEQLTSFVDAIRPLIR